MNVTLFSKYEFSGDIHFSQNWNKKLHCKYFTTIRLKNYAKYQVGNIYKVYKDGNYAIDAKIIHIRYCKIDELPDYTCYLDTGYNKEDTTNLLKKMYQSKEIDWNTQLLAVILLEHLDYRND